MLLATPKALLAFVFVCAAGVTLACDGPPARATGPQGLAVKPPCAGFSTYARPIDEGWGVRVFLINGRSCEAYDCTIRDAEHAFSPQQAIVACRQIYGITGPHV